MNSNENLENSRAAEQPEQKSPEREESRDLRESEELIIQGAELLEEPKDGSFLHGLQVFVAWVQRLFANRD